MTRGGCYCSTLLWMLFPSTCFLFFVCCVPASEIPNPLTHCSLLWQMLLVFPLPKLWNLYGSNQTFCHCCCFSSFTLGSAVVPPIAASFPLLALHVLHRLCLHAFALLSWLKNIKSPSCFYSCLDVFIVPSPTCIK